MKNDDDAPFRPILRKGTKKPTPRRQAAKWVPSKSIPDNASAPPLRHYKHGQPSLVHEYRAADGRLLGYVCRFDVGQTGKLFCPLTWCQNSATGESEWRWKAWETPRPLFSLDRLASNPDAPVVICEGEKAAEAANKLLPDHVAITSPNGSQSAKKADWSPLVGRDIIVWPDNDKPGQSYARDVVSATGGVGVASLRVIEPPQDKPDGWDAADALAEEWTTRQVLDLIDQSCSPSHDPIGSQKKTAPTTHSPSESETQERKKTDSGGRRGKRLRNSLLELVEDCEFWHDQDRRAFATVMIADHFENMRLSSQEFGIWYSGRCHKHLKEPVGEQALRDVMHVLKARAIYEGPCYQTFLRIGGTNGKIYLDLGRPEWDVIVVDEQGWQLTKNCPIKAIRTPHMQTLPIPEGGELLEAKMRPLLNVGSERDFRMIVAWLICAFRDVGEYPILSINGEQGSAKSTIARMVRMLIDPDKATNRAAPQNERDLVVAAQNSHVISLDNLSGLSSWLSDALCRISTGGGFSARALRTDMDEVVVHLENPVILNGIPENAGRPDLTDRSYMISLPAISDDARRTSSELWAEFENARPHILGSVLDAVSTAMRNLPNVKLSKKPRMANAAEWVTAAEEGLGWKPGTHIADLEANRRNAIETSLESEPVAIAIMELHLPWSGTPTRLHEKITGMVPGIPKTVNGLGSALARIKPVLAEVGITIDRKRGKERSVTIRKV